MGTVARFRNVRIVIHTRDHGPPHIHAIGSDAEAVFDIAKLQLISNYGFSTKAIAQIEEFLRARVETLLEAWHEIHEEK
jgi:hypothetical protein